MLGTHDTHATMDALRTLARAHISSELVELQRREDVHKAVREAMKVGMPIDAVSDATGLTPEQIRRIVSNEVIDFDLAMLTGVR